MQYVAAPPTLPVTFNPVLITACRVAQNATRLVAPRAYNTSVGLTSRYAAAL